MQAAAPQASFANNQASFKTMSEFTYPNPTPLAALMETLEKLPLVEEVWPQARLLTFMEAFSKEEPEQAQKLRIEGRFLARLAILPIVAFAGLLNAGKSSSACIFLSPEGRMRVLRGSGSINGTHRFTLWIPSSWAADPELRAQLDTTLTETFGHAPQPLSDEPEQALAQQREREKLEVPLLAFDPALDDRGIALLDCPDIERSEKNGRRLDPARCAMLEKAAGLCAAAVIVARRESIETATLETIERIMPAAVRFLAINHIPGDHSADSVLAEVREQLAHLNGPCYLAFSFRDKEYEARTPAFDPNLQEGSEPIPCFFEGACEKGLNDPPAIEAQRSILHLTRHVSPEQMCQHRQRELQGRFVHAIKSALQILGTGIVRRSECTASAQEDLHKSLLSLWSADGEARMALTPEINQSMGESLQRMAPLDIQAMLYAAKIGDAAWNGVKWAWNITRAFFQGVSAPKQAIGDAAKALGEKLRIHFEGAQFGAAQLRAVLAEFGARHGLSLPKADWERDADSILERFSRTCGTGAAQEQWDQWASQLWKSAPTWKLRLKIAALIPTLLYAAGHTALEPLSGSAIWGITMKELITALGLGGVAAGAMAAGMKGDLQKDIARQQYANFHSAACDQIGVPRGIPVAAGESPYPQPAAPEDRNPDAAGAAAGLWAQARVLPEPVEIIQNQLTTL
jgi:hypothetical protein